MKRLFFTILVALAYILSQAQWGYAPAEARLINANNEYFYTYDVAQTQEGNTWLYMRTEYDRHFVQLYDSTGVALLGDGEMLLISDYQQPISLPINNNMFVDRQGNAIIAIPDLRYTHDPNLTTYSLYKISPEGEFLWGEEGVALNKDDNTYLNACLGMTQLSDDSYVFTWLHSDEEETIFSIDIQRVSNNGELLWNADETRLTDPEGKVTYFWPYVVDAGSGQCILVYTKGSNYDLYARKLDFDGTPVWSEDTRIYRGGFPQTPLVSILDVEPSGDGGVIVTWYDDRNYTDIESIYMSYVKPNGELGFSAGETGQKLAYGDYRALSTTCKYDPASDTFIALWRETLWGQGFYRVVAQSVSREGELLWGEEGLEIEALEESAYSDLTLVNGHEGEIVAYYMKCNNHDYYSCDIRMQRINTLTGAKVWDESKIITDTLSRTHKSSAMFTTMQYHNSGAFAWDDRGITSDPNFKQLYLQRVNYDGTVGNPEGAAEKSVHNSKSSFYAASSIVGDVAVFVADMPGNTAARVAIYDLNGGLVATPFDGVLHAGKQYIEWTTHVPAGVYLATLTTPQGIETVKILVQ